MGVINVLDKHVAELIAAGEVVERPVHVAQQPAALLDPVLVILLKMRPRNSVPVGRDALLCRQPGIPVNDGIVDVLAVPFIKNGDSVPFLRNRAVLYSTTPLQREDQ